MASRLLRFRLPHLGWAFAAGTVLVVMTLAALLHGMRHGAAHIGVVDQPLHFANGALVPGGRWSVLCIDGVSYLQIIAFQGQAIVPKHRRNGLIERCATTGRE